jgi:hypothetical protein
MPHHGLLAVAREPGALLYFTFQIAPAHEQMFAYAPDGWPEMRPGVR